MGTHLLTVKFELWMVSVAKSEQSTGQRIQIPYIQIRPIMHVLFADVSWNKSYPELDVFRREKFYVFHILFHYTSDQNSNSSNSLDPENKILSIMLGITRK